MKMYRGSRVPPPFILNISSTPREEPRVGGPQGHLHIFGEEKNLLPLQGFKLQIVQRVI